MERLACEGESTPQLMQDTKEAAAQTHAQPERQENGCAAGLQHLNQAAEGETQDDKQTALETKLPASPPHAATGALASAATPAPGNLKPAARTTGAHRSQSSVCSASALPTAAL